MNQTIQPALIIKGTVSGAPVDQVIFCPGANVFIGKVLQYPMWHDGWMNAMWREDGSHIKENCRQFDLIIEKSVN